MPVIRLFFLMLLSVPLLSHGQYIKEWTLYIQGKEIISEKGDSARTVKVHRKDNTTLRFAFAPGDTAFKRRLIVMDSDRVGIDDRAITARECGASFNTQELYRRSKGKDVTFYMVTIPADPAKAALVRVAPHPFCSLQWIE